ncbi:MAG: hypothetical protein NTZ73_03270 [Candidatus Diapherotrites archaeon]|nr:hypothetical protein [Candidatus Diapherotrites archaeon]
MSLYGPKFALPTIPVPTLPDIDFDRLKNPIVAIIAMIVVAIILFLLFSFFESQNGGIFSEPIRADWTNNPLDLTKDSTGEALLRLTLTNISKETADITFNVDTNSEEILIYPSTGTFPNVAPGDYRKANCIVRANPNATVFSGSYTISIKTDLGEKKTKLEIITP